MLDKMPIRFLIECRVMARPWITTGHVFHLMAPTQKDQITKSRYFRNHLLNSAVILTFRDIAQ